jgi:hypothetical protein
MPNLLQAALFASEFEDVLYYTSPPRGCRSSCSVCSPRSAGPWDTGAAIRGTLDRGLRARRVPDHPPRPRWQ